MVHSRLLSILHFFISFLPSYFFLLLCSLNFLSYYFLRLPSYLPRLTQLSSSLPYLPFTHCTSLTPPRFVTPTDLLSTRPYTPLHLNAFLRLHASPIPLFRIAISLPSSFPSSLPTPSPSRQSSGSGEARAGRG